MSKPTTMIYNSAHHSYFSLWRI